LLNTVYSSRWWLSLSSDLRTRLLIVFGNQIRVLFQERGLWIRGLRFADLWWVGRDVGPWFDL